jgi:hypothetical protein
MAVSISLTGPNQITMNGQISIVDPTGVQAPLSKIIPSLVQNMSASTFGQTTVGTAATVLPLPASPTQLFYIKNLSTTTALAVTWTPVGLAAVEVQTLQPGGILFFFNPGNGITNLSLVSASTTITVPIDYVLAG